MGKVYESAAKNRRVGGIRFQPDASTRSKANPEGFGRLDSANPLLLKRTGLTVKQVEEAIEAEKDYRKGIPGKSGIWLKERRVAQQGTQAISAFRDSLDDLDESALRKMISDSGNEVPGQSATRDQLIDAVIASVAAPKAKRESKPKKAAEAPTG